ncbi:MAG: hypothetical protein GX036_10745 [Firmicutes bacterium]|jgi:methyl-accepting chemotaxis protein|nr:hypothetical protein [Bacillota bacterium]
MKKHHVRHEILHEHELWANKVGTVITGVFGFTAVPVFLAIPNVLIFWRIMLSIIGVLLATGLIAVSRNKKTAGLTKYILTVVLVSFGFLMTITMGEGNRCIPFYFFSLPAFCLIYLNPRLILIVIAETIFAHVIMMTYFPEEIFALHQPAMYIYATFIYLLYCLAVYTIAVKALSLLGILGKREEEQTRLNRHLTDIQQRIAVASTQLRKTSVALSQQAGEMLASSQETAAGMEEMARMVDVETSEVTKVSQSVSEINEIAEEIRKKTMELADAFDKTHGLSMQGAELIYSTIDGIQKTGVHMAEVVDATRRLKESSLKISSILKIMNEIAEKTTLLSVNANIEAARAGSTGQGFAVVAMEIKKLAEQSAQGTEEIKSIIGDTLLDVDKVMTAIESSLATVEEGSRESYAVSGSIEKIMENISKNSEQIRTIHQALEKLVAMNNNIMDATNSLAGIAEETSAGTEEISATTQQQAIAIDHIVEQIKELEQMASALDLLVSKAS